MDMVFADVIDINETNLLREYPEVLRTLLTDKTTGRFLLWCTDDYAGMGEGYQPQDEMLPERITVANEGIIKSRCMKDKETQIRRIRAKGEVFTPAWLCNKMNNVVDKEWFGREDIFNKEEEKSWTRIKQPKGFMPFPDKKMNEPKSWQNYIKLKRLEITCGEAPYLTSRYDMVEGEKIIPVMERIGLLDRKMQVIHQQIRAGNKANWLRYAKIALQSVYGYDWQGDNVVLARENLLMDMIAFYQYKFHEDPEPEIMQEWAEIIAWNIWQMDGLKYVIPNSCHDVEISMDLFGTDTEQADVAKDPCPGCKNNKFNEHTGVYCKIMDWEKNESFEFRDLVKEGGIMPKKADFKFDVIIGNPPYQEETSIIVAENNRQKPVRNIFQFFQEAADSISNSIVCLIYPGGRWIQWFGKGLKEFGLHQINSENLSSLIFYPFAEELFPGIQIPDGISIVLKNMTKTSKEFKYVFVENGKSRVVLSPCPGEDLMPLNPLDVEVCSKMSWFVRTKGLKFLHEGILARSLFKIESDFVEKNPDKVVPYEAGKEFNKLTEIKLLTNDKAGKMGRAKWYVSKREIITENAKYINQWKVVVSSANAGGQKRDNQLEIIDNYSAFGRSRLALKSFQTEVEARNFYRYVSSYIIRYAFLMTDESLNSLGKRVPDIVDYSDNNPYLNFSKPIDPQLKKLFNLTSEDMTYVTERVDTIRNSK